MTISRAVLGALMLSCLAVQAGFAMWLHPDASEMARYPTFIFVADVDNNMSTETELNPRGERYKTRTSVSAKVVSMVKGVKPESNQIVITEDMTNTDMKAQLEEPGRHLVFASLVSQGYEIHGGPYGYLPISEKNELDWFSTHDRWVFDWVTMPLAAVIEDIKSLEKKGKTVLVPACEPGRQLQKQARKNTKRK